VSPETRQKLSLFAGTKSIRRDYRSSGFAETILMATLLVVVANRSCVLMIAPPLCQTVGFHSVTFRCRAGGRQIFLRFANSSFFE
jgi:hypothetical protein